MAKLITIPSQMLRLLSGVICTLMTLCPTHHSKGNGVSWNINWDPKRRLSIVNAHYPSGKELTIQLEVTGGFSRFVCSMWVTASLETPWNKPQRPQHLAAHALLLPVLMPPGLSSVSPFMSRPLCFECSSPLCLSDGLLVLHILAQVPVL